MKKIIIATALLIGINTFVNAQEKIGVGVMPFSNLGNASQGDVIAIQEAVTNAFVKTKRFNIVDRSKMEALKKEKDLQKSEDFIDGTVIEQGHSLGASYLISGKVSSVTKSSGYKNRTKLDGTTESVLVNEAQINFSCQVIDVATGQVINSETFSNSGGGQGFFGGSSAGSVDAAFTQSLSSLTSDIDKWVNKNFPATFPIVEIQEKDSKGNAIKVMIAGGSAFNLQKGDRLKVVEVSTIEVNGKKLERKKEIGELKISKVEDENFSTCSVKSGGIDINARFEAKAKLLVITKD
jgi:curli biogenesis system outer membrane secretion channel CsgG